MSDSPFRHPDPLWLMPVPRDMAVTPSQNPDDFERMTEKEATDSLLKSERPGHLDNRGMDPAGGGERP